jgi:hypothetical protein
LVCGIGAWVGSVLAAVLAESLIELAVLTAGRPEAAGEDEGAFDVALTVVLFVGTAAEATFPSALAGVLLTGTLFAGVVVLSTALAGAFVAVAALTGSLLTGTSSPVVNLRLDLHRGCFKARGL